MAVVAGTLKMVSQQLGNNAIAAKAVSALGKLITLTKLISQVQATAFDNCYARA
jgi:hypothetical protein